jgi:transposase
VCDALGNPLTAILTPGQHHDSTVGTELVASVRVQTSAAGGRPRTRPKLVVADRGYDASAFRRYLRRRGVRCVIPKQRVPAGKRRRRRGRPPTFCRATYRQHNVVERLIGWLKEHRRIATRFEKVASSFSGDGEVVVRAALLPHVRAVFGQYVGENESGPGHPSAQ